MAIVLICWCPGQLLLPRYPTREVLRKSLLSVSSRKLHQRCFGKRDSIHHHLLDMIFWIATVLELRRQKLLYIYSPPPPLGGGGCGGVYNRSSDTCFALVTAFGSSSSSGTSQQY